MDKISPTGDLAFKKVLASEENKDILAGLITDFFGVEVQDLIIENPYDIALYREALQGDASPVLRQTLKDVSATFKAADYVSEIQLIKTRYFDERSLFYPLSRYCQNYNQEGRMEIGPDGKPNRFSSLRPVYALNILGYNHFREDGDALRIFELYDPKRNKGFGKKLLHIGYFELPKTAIETTNQKHWHDYFTSGSVGGDSPAYIRKAAGIIDFFNLSEEERKMALALERAQADYDAGIVGAYFDGRDEGMAEGLAEGLGKGLAEGLAEGLEKGLAEGLLKGEADKARAIAVDLLQEGIPVAVIVKCTGLSVEYIQTITR